MKDNSIFKSKFFLKLFYIPSIVWIILLLLAIVSNETDLEPITWGELIISDIIILAVWFIISVIIYFIYKKIKKENIQDNEKERDDKAFKKVNTFKKIRFPFIISIITFLIGVLLSYDSIGYPLKTKLIILFLSFIPFVIFLIIIFIIYKFKENQKIVSVFKNISIIITTLLLFYYFIAIFVIVLEEATNPITNPKYYSKYVSGARLRKIFPKKIPDNAEKIEFYYAPGILQGGTNYSLYYIDKNMTMDKFDKKYKEKAIWIGHKDEYTEKEGLFTGAFSYTPADYKNEDDYIIYLIEGRCDDSGWCNHGDFLIAAYNEQTNEIVFRSEQW